MSFDIAYIVSHGFAARMILQTNLLGKLAAKGLKVAVISPDKNDPNLVELTKDAGISLFEFNEKSKFSNENYMFKRKYYLENMAANPALWEKHIYSTRYNTSLHPLRRIRPFYYGMVHGLIKYFPFIRENFRKREKRYLRSVRAERLIDELAPKKLVATYPVNFNETVLLHYGNMHPGVETWIHLLSWDNITCKGHFVELADKYIAWGPIMQEELREYYAVEEKDIFMTGVPHFDLHVSLRRSTGYKAVLKAMGLVPEVPYLFFAMSSPRFAPCEIDIVEWLAEKIETGAFGDLQLVVRPHPQNVSGNMADKAWMPRLKDLNKYSRVKVDFPDLVKSRMNWSMDRQDMIRLSQLIGGASITLNSGSTVTIDALMHHKPVVMTSFDAHRQLAFWRSARRLPEYFHLKKLINEGGAILVHNFSEIEQIIIHLLKNPDYLKAVRLRALEQECFRDDGLATDRVVEVLSGLKESHGTN